MVKHPDFGRGKIINLISVSEGGHFEYGIKFNKKHEVLHTLSGDTPDGYGWYCLEEQFTRYCLEEHFTIDPISYLKEIDDKIKEN